MHPKTRTFIRWASAQSSTGSSIRIRVRIALTSVTRTMGTNIRESFLLWSNLKDFRQESSIAYEGFFWRSRINGPILRGLSGVCTPNSREVG